MKYVMPSLNATIIPGILIRSIYLLFLFIPAEILMVKDCYGQDVTLPKQPIPKSPDVASLLKFIENPVSVSTGLPEISIPLHTLSSQFVNLPISLGYHSGGIKVTETAPWTGMGWSLLSGGVITQNIKGLDDYAQSVGAGRLNNPFTNMDNPVICELKDIVESKIDAQPDIFSFSFAGKSGQFFIADDHSIGLVSETKLKIEPLPGFVSGQGYSVSSWRVTDINGVKYEFNDYGTVETRTVSVMNGTVSNWEIEYNIPVKTQRTYYLSKIIQPNGEEIVFQYDPYSIKNVDHTSDNKTGINGSVSKNYQTSLIQEKRIRSITFPNGKLEFVPGPNRCDLYGDKMLDKVVLYDASNNKKREFRLNYMYHVGSSAVQVSALTFDPLKVPYFIGSTAAAIDNDDYKDKRLFLYSVDEIDVATNLTAHSYQFDYTKFWGLPDRFSAHQDWWGYYNGNGQNSLMDGIYQDPALLTLSYLYTTPHRSPNLARTQEGILKKITYPTGGYAEFEYEQNTTLGNPVQTAPYIQHQAVTYNVGPNAANVYLGDLNINNSPNRTVQIKFEVQTCINGPLVLNRPFSIRDAAGNTVYSEAQISAAPFESGPGSPSPYRIYTLDLTNGNYKIYSAISGVPCSYYIKVLTWYEDAPFEWMSAVGGVRIKRSILYDPVTNTQLIKAYDYNQTINGVLQSSGKHTGGTEFKTGYSYVVSDGLEYGSPQTPNIPTGEKTKTLYILTSSPVYPLGSICYSKITERRVNQSGNDLGRTEYTYLNNNDTYSSTYTVKNYSNGFVFGENDRATPLYNIVDNSILRNKLTKKEDFANVNGLYKSILKEEYFYMPVPLTAISGLASTYHFRSAMTLGTTCPAYSTFLPQFDKIAYMKYTNSYSYLRLESSTTTETTLDDATLTRNREYEYSTATLQPKKTTETNSTGKKLVSTYKYAGDYANVTNPANGILNLQQRYAIGAVVEQSKYNINPQNNVEQLISSSFISYLTGLPLPSTIYAIESATPLTDFVPSSVQGGAVVKDSRYVTQLFFHQYDAKGNILEQQKANNIKEVYLWGYNSQYPVAKVTGSDYNTVQGFISQSILDNPATTETAMRTELNKIRTGLAGTKAMVFTYTYKPLTGITSETDATGKVLYYEYDSLGRVKVIRDQNNMIIKQYDYKYQASL